ncbi:aminopeptidase P family protein [Microbulbifer elongatus]|uniref:aminopeptidase P family protein n=1 Tax=Microbulbifer elongatus TaxID=86173 RepID=UPI001CFCE613|nr:aminopeptidase P family protein [Microbulbifer elongatus]
MNPLNRYLGLLALACIATLSPALSTADTESEANIDLSSNYFSAKEYKQRRARVFEAMGENAILILLSEKGKVRNDDVEWPFRQDQNLLYLTGLNTPETHLVMIKSGREQQAHLFHQLDNPDYEKWHGKLPDEDTLRTATGIEHIRSSKDFDEFLDLLFRGYNTKIRKGREHFFDKPEYPQLVNAIREGTASLWLSLGNRRGLEKIPRPRESSYAEKFKTRFPELRIANISPIIHTQREVKSDAELAALKRAIDITVAGHKVAMRSAPVSEYEYQVKAAIDYLFAAHGSHWGFPAITASGDNAAILHYAHPHEQIDHEGLFLVDIGAEVEHYTADVTRTFPASGKFSDKQKEVYAAALNASDRAIAAARPGRDILDIERAILDSHAESLMELGLITEQTDEQVHMYYWHSYGHSIGLDVHDTLNRYGKLRADMVIAIEPGLYIRRNVVENSDTYQSLDEEAQASISKALEKYDGIGVRIEDNVQITARGATLLSAAAPRTIAAIEDFMTSGDETAFNPSNFMLSRATD